MIVLHQFISEPTPCEYLPDRYARMEYAAVGHISPEEYEGRMDTGWRKFGHWMFRPVCAGCQQCRPLRIPVADFTPDRSQRRAQRRNADLAVRYAVPTVDAARLDLFHRYHQAQAARKGWPEGERGAVHYAGTFVHNPLPGVEITVWEGEVLRAVVLTDITPRAVSGVYHYHDPDRRERGLGTFAMLQTLELARRLERPFAYFGFYVADCASLSYKARFRPCELLGTDGLWRPFAPGPRDSKEDHEG